MKTRPVKPVLSQIDKTIASKEKLIVTLHAKIAGVREDAEAQVKAIQYRITLARTLLDALKKGR
jgi:hypothetical protein